MFNWNILRILLFNQNSCQQCKIRGEISSYFPLGVKPDIGSEKNSWMQDPRYKHEYLDRGQSWTTVTEGNGDESDKHI